jgi:hypothetical protein
LVARGVVFGRGVHAAEMLCEEVFAVEVVVVEGLLVVGIGRWGAEVAAPVAEFDVLGADVPLPLVLGGEVGGAAICGEGARERSSFVCLGGSISSGF